MALKQSYKGKEIHEIRSICCEDNKVDVITKTSLNSVLKRLISTNKATIRLER